MPKFNIIVKNKAGFNTKKKERERERERERENIEQQQIIFRLTERE